MVQHAKDLQLAYVCEAVDAVMVLKVLSDPSVLTPSICTALHCMQCVACRHTHTRQAPVSIAHESHGLAAAKAGVTPNAEALSPTRVIELHTERQRAAAELLKQQQQHQLQLQLQQQQAQQAAAAGAGSNANAAAQYQAHQRALQQQQQQLAAQQQQSGAGTCECARLRVRMYLCVSCAGMRSWNIQPAILSTAFWRPTSSM